jgi:hypothetical protein
MTNLKRMLGSRVPEMDEIAEHLDRLTSSARTDEAMSLDRDDQRKLFDLAKGRALDLSYFVPGETLPMREVVHEGRNSLPAFRRFAKVFVRPDGPEAETPQLWGYNRNPRLIETAVGPGHYVALPYSVPGEVVIDYRKLPPRKPAHWPPIISNRERLSVVVYNGMEDVMRRVSAHVSIGRATKGGKLLDNWFVLCRQV